MPDKLVEWKSASLRSGVSSFGFSGTNGHGLMEAILTQPSEPKPVKPMYFARKVLKPWRDWVAVKELDLSYSIGETLVFTNIYPLW